MKILVKAVAPGSIQVVVKCTSSADFLVHCVTNGGGRGYAIGVQSTGASFGTDAPTFTVGGIASDIVTVIIQPGTTCYITLETENTAQASIT
jgi:hypothetical protein